MVAKLLSPAAIWGGDSIPLVADRLGNALPGRSLNPLAQAVCKRVIEGVYRGDLLLGDLHRVLDPVEGLSWTHELDESFRESKGFTKEGTGDEEAVSRR